jgi:hypothetical protein
VHPRANFAAVAEMLAFDVGRDEPSPTSGRQIRKIET